MERIPVNPIPEIMDWLAGIEIEKNSSDIDMPCIIDGDEKLPSISDPFWEQLFTSSPLLGDADEFDSGIHETGEIQRMDYLTE